MRELNYVPNVPTCPRALLALRAFKKISAYLLPWYNNYL